MLLIKCHCYLSVFVDDEGKSAGTVFQLLINLVDFFTLTKGPTQIPACGVRHVPNSSGRSALQKKINKVRQSHVVEFYPSRLKIDYRYRYIQLFPDCSQTAPLPADLFIRKLETSA